MATLLEELQKVQPCDGRGLIQLLTQRIIQEALKLKTKACDQVAVTLQDYGLEEIYPCDYLTEEFLRKLTENEPLEAISTALVKAGYPPHLLKVFTKGFDDLEDNEFQEILEWTQPLTGILVHPNTAKYLRGETETTLQTTLQTVIVEDVETFLREATPKEVRKYEKQQKKVIDERELQNKRNLEEAREEFYTFIKENLVSTEEELGPVGEDDRSFLDYGVDPTNNAGIGDQTLTPNRFIEILSGTGPKLSAEEIQRLNATIRFWKWSSPTEYSAEDKDINYTSNVSDLLIRAIKEDFIPQPTLSSLISIFDPTVVSILSRETGVISAADAFAGGTSLIPEVDVNPQGPLMVEDTRIVSSSFQQEVTEEVTTRVSDLTKDEIREVEEFYINQGIRNIVATFAVDLKSEIYDKITCPTQETTQDLINRIKNLTRIVNSVKERLVTIQTIVNITSALVNALNIIIDKLVKVIDRARPLIVSLAAVPVTAGLAALLNNIVSIVSRILIKIEPRVETLDKQACAAAGAITFVTANLSVVDAFIRVADELLGNCLEEEASTGIDVPNIPRTGNPVGSGVIRYRGYVLEVRTRASDNPIKQRYAVALDANGVVAIQGPLSYSADPEILIEELKYRIDTYLG